eukprot:4130819-Amphidinium_carterae.1
MHGWHKLPKGNVMIADMSPENLYLTPPMKGYHIAYDFPHARPTAFNLPAVIRDLYGSQSTRVTFIATLREPLSRMHSDYHFDIHLNARANEMSSRPDSKAFVQHIL